MSTRTLQRAEARLGWAWALLFVAAMTIEGVTRQVRRARSEHAAEAAQLRDQLDGALEALHAAKTQPAPS